MSILGNLVEAMTGAIVDGIINTGNKAEHVEAQDKVRRFLTNNYSRLEAWVVKNPGKRPPVYFDHNTGEVIWLRRTQVRRMNRKLAKLRARG